MRWPWSDPVSLSLLADSPVDCLLLKSYSAAFVKEALARGLTLLAVVTPGDDAVAHTRDALAAHLTGIVLDGDFPEGTAAAVRRASGDAPVVELTARSRMRLDSHAPVLGTWQGVWPGIAVQENGSHRAGPTGSAWIDTNTGFIRAARAWGDRPLWVANLPPARTVITGERYLQAIADAAISGARWVLALDDDFASRLAARRPLAVRDWARISGLLRFFESHPEWHGMREYGKLAVVQDSAKGGLLSGGILDMIAVKHTPVRPVPLQNLSPAALEGATMAVDVDTGSLTPEQREILRGFARRGGTLLTGPPGWEDQRPAGERITLDAKDLERLNDIWRDVNALVGHSDQGIRLFNVASMLSNVLVSADGKSEIIHLVNYSDYPVENVTIHFAGGYKRATFLAPEAAPRALEVYPVEENAGVDIDRVAVCATIKLEL